MAAPAGAPTRLKVSVFAGRSGSVAPAVKVDGLPALTVVPPGTPNTGGRFTSLTVTVTGFSSERLGVPLSVTRTLKVNVPGPWASVGVQVNTPVTGSMAAPLGAPTRLKVSVLAGMSGSVAVAVKV